MPLGARSGCSVLWAAGRCCYECPSRTRGGRLALLLPRRLAPARVWSSATARPAASASWVSRRGGGGGARGGSRDAPSDRRQGRSFDGGAGGELQLRRARSRGQAATVVLEKGKSRLFWGASGNPIVYGGAVARISGGAPSTGDAVLLADHNGSLLGWGAFNRDSAYRVRLLQSASEAAAAPALALDFDALIDARVRAAAALRARMGLPTPGRTTGYRLVNSEGDRLSGLTVDVFGDYAVAVCTAAWVEQRRGAVAAAVLRAVRCRAVVWRANADLLRREGLGGTSGSPPQPAEEDAAAEADAEAEPATGAGGGVLAFAADGSSGPVAWLRAGESDGGALAVPAEVEVLEEGVRFVASLAAGQKSGFYFDQRENRRRVRDWAAGAAVLDLCCYSGGFAIGAALGGAASVVAVDSSASALALAAANAARNSVGGSVRFEEGDAEAWMRAAAAAGRLWDVVVLDPPKLAPTRAALPRALGKYRRLNELALRLTRPGGLLVTCSCSGAMTQGGELEPLVAEAAGAAGRAVTLLARSGAGGDHAQHPGYPEGNYLSVLTFGVA